MAEHVLIVDDETNMRWVLKEALSGLGYDTRVAAGGEEALAEMARIPAGLVLLDLKLKGMDGLATLRRLRERWPESVVIILTAYGTVATAVEAMQLGAADYLRKPFDVGEIGFKINRALERRALQAELRSLRAARAEAPAAPAGVHPAWLRCLEQAQSLTALDLDIVFAGESGAGRRTLARYAHAISDRREAPLVELDLQSVPVDAQSRFLVGDGDVEGVWTRCGAGTLLLADVQCLTAAAWATLNELAGASGKRRPRLLLTAEAEPAPHHALKASGRIRVPALRERVGDIVLLAQTFAPMHAWDAGALQALDHYSWPENVVELQSVVRRAAALAGDGRIDEQHLPAHLRPTEGENTPIRLPAEGLSMEQVEVSLLRQALQRASGNKSRAAELLGLSRHTLLYRMEKYGLDQEPNQQ